MSILTMKSVADKIIKTILYESESQGIKWTRLTELNRLLKGFRPGELTVLSGKTGTGKTTFISEYSLDLAQSGVNTLWGSFEISVPKLSKTLLTQFLRKSLLLHPHLIKETLDLFTKTVPIFFMDTSKQYTFEELIRTMHCGVNNFGVQHIILDNLQFIVGNMGKNMAEKLFIQDQLVGDIRRFVNETGTHVTMIAHPRKENTTSTLTINSLYGGCKLSQEADNILLLQSIEEKNKKYIQVVKNRHDGTVGSMNLNFRMASLSYSNSKLKEVMLEDNLQLEAIH